MCQYTIACVFCSQEDFPIYQLSLSFSFILTPSVPHFLFLKGQKVVHFFTLIRSLHTFGRQKWISPYIYLFYIPLFISHRPKWHKYHNKLQIPCYMLWNARIVGCKCKDPGTRNTRMHTVTVIHVNPSGMVMKWPTNVHELHHVVKNPL